MIHANNVCVQFCCYRILTGFVGCSGHMELCLLRHTCSEHSSHTNKTNEIVNSLASTSLSRTSLPEERCVHLRIRLTLELDKAE